MSGHADLVADDVAAAFAGGYTADPRLVSQDIDVRRVEVIDFGLLDSLTQWDHAAPVSKAILVFVRSNPERILPGKDARRNSVAISYPIQVAIAAKLKTTVDCSDTKPLKQVSQELREWFYMRDRKLPTREETIDEETELQLLLDGDPDSLRGSNLFLAEFIITFWGYRAR